MGAPRVVVVTRKTAYTQLLERHGTAGQAGFFLQSRGQSLDPVRTRHDLLAAAVGAVLGAIPLDWRRARVDRDDLDRFLFEPDDLVVPVGPDGLVANLAKYLDGQPVIGVNPSPELSDGVLAPHPPEAVADLLHATSRGSATVRERTMVQASLDDGQRLRALNEIFVGHTSHQSARYRIRVGDEEERQSSSGVIIATGTGSTGWARSIHRERHCAFDLPIPHAPVLSFFVREAWPSGTTGTTLTHGLLHAGQTLTLTSEMDGSGLVFGDGIESDRLDFTWGSQLTIAVAASSLAWVAG